MIIDCQNFLYKAAEISKVMSGQESIECWIDILQ